MTDIARAEAFGYEWKVERKNSETLVLEPIDEGSIVRAWLSLTFKGDAVTAESVLSLVRGQRTPHVDARLLWSGVLDADLATAALAGIATNDPVYEVVEIDGERKSRVLTVID